MCKVGYDSIIAFFLLYFHYSTLIYIDLTSKNLDY